MSDETNFADTIRPFMRKANESDASDDSNDALEYLSDLNVSIVPAEVANKGVPGIRRSSRAGIPSMIANRGTIKSLKETDILMSVDQLVGLLGRAFEGGERRASSRKPAGSILAQLVPTHVDLKSLTTASRARAEIIGGRRELN